MYLGFSHAYFYDVELELLLGGFVNHAAHEVASATTSALRHG
jgi:hypothetical protein